METPKPFNQMTEQDWSDRADAAKLTDAERAILRDSRKARRSAAAKRAAEIRAARKAFANVPKPQADTDAFRR